MIFKVFLVNFYIVQNIMNDSKIVGVAERISIQLVYMSIKAD